MGRIIAWLVTSCLLVATVSLAQRVGHYSQPGNSFSTSTDSVLTVIGQWAWGHCYAVDTSRGYAAIGNGFTFQLLDVSDPLNPRIVGEYVTIGEIYDIEVRGNLAFVCTAGLLILDISDPTRPRMVSQVRIGGAISLAVEDSLVYITWFSGGIQVIDVSNPSNPKLRGGLPVAGQGPWALAAKGKYAYVGTLEYPGLNIIDATNPDTLKESLVDVAGWVHAAFLKGSYLYLGTANGNAMRIFDVSSPTSPYEVGTLAMNSDVGAITVSGNYAFIVSGSFTYLVDVSNASQPRIIRQLLSAGADIALSTGYLFTASGSGLMIARAVPPDTLQNISVFLTGGSGAYGVAVKDQYVFLAVGYAGLAVLDVSDPTAPRRVGAVESQGQAFEIALNGNYAYVGTENLCIVDISNPQSPQSVGSVPLNGTPIQIFIENNRAYVVVVDSGLAIFDLSNPAMPAMLAFYRSPAYRVAARGNVACLARAGNGLEILDVSNPRNPTKISRQLRYALGVWIQDTLVYVATDTGLAILDISNPSSPSVLSSIATPWPHAVTDMSLSKNMVYLSYGDLIAVDISNPFAPSIVGKFTPLFGQAVASREQYVYLCDAPAGFKILRNDLITSVQTKKIDLKGDYELYQNYPNPFNNATVIRFFAPRTETVQLEVFNLLGQKVSSLLDEVVSPGEHQVMFNASALSSGLFFYRLRSSTKVVTKTMLLLK